MREIHDIEIRLEETYTTLKGKNWKVICNTVNIMRKTIFETRTVIMVEWCVAPGPSLVRHACKSWENAPGIGVSARLLDPKASRR